MDEREPRTKRAGRYQQEKKRDEDDWGSPGQRPQLQQALINTMVLPDDAACLDCGAVATMVCRSCCFVLNRCEACMLKHHQAIPNHDMFIVIHEEIGLVPYRSETPLVLRAHPLCETSSQSMVSLISLKGSQKYSMQYCSCEEPAAQLVKLGFWPHKPTRPLFAFSLTLIDLYRSVNLHSKSALR